jgi:hypothetical protein
MTITLVRNGRPVTYRLAIVRCGCSSHVVVRGFAVRDCGRCGEVPFA